MPCKLGLFLFGQSIITGFHLETLGSPVFPYYPCLPLICSQTPVESLPLVNNAG